MGVSIIAYASFSLLSNMGDNSAAKIWVPIIVACSILLFFLVFGCLCSQKAFDNVPPADLLTLRRGRPGFQVQQQPRQLPRGVPLEEFVMAREERRGPGQQPEFPRRPDPVFIVRGPRRARSPVRRYQPIFDPEDPDPWFGRGGPMFPGGLRGGPEPRIIERQPLFV